MDIGLAGRKESEWIADVVEREVVNSAAAASPDFHRLQDRLERGSCSIFAVCLASNESSAR